jgi:gliding motility-associated-like protein
MYDSCSIKRDTAIVTVNVRGHVRGNARPDTTLCIGEGVQIYAQPTGGLETDYAYRWYYGEDTNVVSTDSLFSWPSIDTTAIFKLVTDDGGCSDEMDTSFFKAIRRETIELFTRSDTTICNGQSIWLTASGTGGHSAGYTFTWDNGLPQNDSNLVTPTNTLTTYRVLLSDHCTNTEDTGFITIKLRFPLTLLVRPDTLICRGEPILLHVDGTGGDSLHYSFIWENVGVGNDISVVPTANTKYKVTLTDNCTSLSTEDSVMVTLRAPLGITTSPDTLICQENTANLRAWATGGNVPTHEFVWSDGATETILAPGVPYPVTPGVDFTYSVRVQDNCTVIKDSSTIRVTLRAPLSVTTIPTDTTICHGAIATLKASGTGGWVGHHTYNWENIGAGAVQAVQPLVDSSFRVIMSDGCSPWDTAYVKITIAAPLKVVGGGDTLVCPEKRVYIDAEGSGGVASAYTYTWSHGLGGGKVKQVSPGTDQAYVITLSDNCSFSAHDTIYVTMAALPDTDISSDFIVGCQPLMVNFSSEHVDAGGFSNWEWHLEPKVKKSATVNQLPHLFEKPGLYPVKLFVTTSYGCLDSSDVLDITVHPKPVAIFDFTPKATTILNPTITLLNTSTNGFEYDWDFGDGNVSSAENPTHTYSDTGHYPVTLLVTSDEGCLDTLEKVYHIEDVFTCFIPSGFTPNGDRHNDKFSITGTGVKKLKVQIYDRWGALVFESTDRNFAWDGKSRESGEPLPMGVYMYRITVDMENGGREQYKGTISLVR